MRARRFLWPLLVAAGLLAFFVGGVAPTRAYLDQRNAIAAEEEKIEVLAAENARLASRVHQLGTDVEIERLAREQYNLVRPGEEAYAILPGPADPQPERLAPVPPSKPDKSSWWDWLADALTFWD